MRDDDLPQWLKEIGRRPKIRETGRPVPPIRGSLKVEKVFDPVKAAALARDLHSLIEDSTPDQQDDLHSMILDSMTANRIDNLQTHRLLSRLWQKNGNGGPGLSIIDHDGIAHEMNWGAV